MFEPVSEWDRYRNEFFKRCEDIYRQRGDQYNREADIREYWIYGIPSIFHCIWAKALRLKSIISLNLFITERDRGTFEDSLFDIVNYASFCYAENKCREAEKGSLDRYMKREKNWDDAIKQVTESCSAERNSSTTPGNVERVVLEPGQIQDNDIPAGSDHPFSNLHEDCPACLEHAKRTRPDTGDGKFGMGPRSYSTIVPGADSKDT